MDPLWLIAAFLAGCCVGIAPWHWLAKKNRRIAAQIQEDLAEIRGHS